MSTRRSVFVKLKNLIGIKPNLSTAELARVIELAEKGHRVGENATLSPITKPIIVERNPNTISDMASFEVPPTILSQKKEITDPADIRMRTEIRKKYEKRAAKSVDEMMRRLFK